MHRAQAHELQPPATGQGWEARLHLGFDAVAGRSRLRQARHQGPLRVQRSFHPEGPGVCQVLVLHPPGGIAGGDRLAITLETGPGAFAQLSTPGAGKWYRAAGRPARQELQATLAAGSVIEWLPQESIVFDGAEATMHNRIRLADGACWLGLEVTVLGRRARGESFTQGRVQLGSRIDDAAGRPLWFEQGGWAGGEPGLARPAGLHGQPAFGSLVLAGPAIAADWLAACRSLPPTPGVEAGATALPRVLLLRARGTSAAAVRAHLLAAWTRLRPLALGREALPLRIWQT